MNNIIESLQPLAVPIQSVTPDPRNARSHPDKNIDTIKKSLDTYGQTKPIVVNRSTGIIIAGNGLYRAAVALGWKQIAVTYVDFDEDYAKGYAVMDNQSALTSEWEMGTLKDILEELDHGAFDMDATGFTEDELEQMMTQFHVGEAEPPELADGDRAPIQQMTFTLHDSQAETVKAALSKAQGEGHNQSDVNENTNGNALAWIAETFLNG